MKKEAKRTGYLNFVFGAIKEITNASRGFFNIEEELQVLAKKFKM